MLRFVKVAETAGPQSLTADPKVCARVAAHMLPRVGWPGNLLKPVTARRAGP